MDIPCRVYRGDGNDRVVLWVYFGYLIGWAGIICGTVPGTED